MVSLHEVAKIVDCEHKTAPTVEHNPFAFAVGTPALKHGRIDVSNARPISQETYESWTRRSIPRDGDIIMSREAPVGRLGYVDSSQRYCLGQRTVLVRADPDQVLPKYLYHLVRGRYIQEWMSRRAMGSTVHHLNVADIKQMPVGQLPSLENQTQIVELLDPLEKLIEACLETSKRQNELGDFLYHAWFHQFDFPTPEGQPYRSSGGKLESTDTLGLEIPSGWEVKKLDNYLDFQRGFDPGSQSYGVSYDHKTSIPFIRVGDLEQPSDIAVDKDTKGLVICRPEDLIVSFDGSVGKVATGLSGAISGGLRIVQPKTQVISRSVAYFIMRSQRIQSIMQKYSTGSVLKHASSSIPKLVIPFSSSQMEAFSELANPLFSSIQQLNLTRETLEQGLLDATAKLIRF